MAGMVLMPLSVACMWITIIGYTTISGLEKDEFSCYESGQEIPKHRLTCPSIGGQNSRIIIRDVTGVHIISDDVSRCNGEIECDIHDVISANESIHYQCVQAVSFSRLDDSSRNITEGLLEVKSNHNGIWSITTSTKAVKVFLVTAQEKDFKELTKILLTNNSNGDIVPLFNTSVDFGAGYGTCITKLDTADPVSLLVHGNTVSQQLIPQYFINVKGVDECNDTASTEVLERSLKCSLKSTAPSTTESTLGIVTDKENPGQKDEEAGDSDDSSDPTSTSSVGFKEPTEAIIGVASSANDSRLRNVTDKENPGQKDKEADDSDDSDDPKSPSSAGLNDSEAIIGVVATLAILFIIICSVFLIARCIRKRGSRERPLLITSHKSEPNNQDVPLEQFASAKGYVNVDETKGGFSLSDYRLSAPQNQGVHNASFTDTIDLDGSEAADSVRPSEQETNLEGLPDIDKKTFDGAKLDGESSPGPVSYESTFEGSLEQLRHEMTMETSDGGSSEELNQGSVPNELDNLQDDVTTDREVDSNEPVAQTPEGVTPEIHVSEDKTDPGIDRESSHSHSSSSPSPLHEDRKDNRQGSEDKKEPDIDRASSHSHSSSSSSSLHEDRKDNQQRPEDKKDPDIDSESSHSHSSSSSSSLQDDRKDNKPEGNNTPDQSGAEDNSNEESSQDLVDDGSISLDNDVVDLTADFSEC